MKNCAPFYSKKSKSSVPLISEIVVTEEIQNSKKNEQFELKLKNIKELLVSYDMTFKQILESLSMNQMSINDLRDSLTSPATTTAQAI